MSWLELENKVVVVTGAARGIGESIALAFAEQGARVAALDLNADGAAATSAAITAQGGDAIAVEVNTGREDSVAAAYEKVIDQWGTVDVLVNNAGISRGGPIADLELKDWQAVLDVNLTGYLLCAQRFADEMLRKGAGSVVHVASATAHDPHPGSGAYSPAKAGLVMMSRLMALEWGPRGVRSNTVSPGLVRTPLTEGSYQDPRVLAERENLIPARRIGTGQDTAEACLWLASRRASYVTGQDVAVDGGLGQSLLTHVAATSRMA